MNVLLPTPIGKTWDLQQENSFNNFKIVSAKIYEEPPPAPETSTEGRSYVDDAAAGERTGISGAR